MSRTILTIAVEHNTSEDHVLLVLNNLLQTALDTPGILDDLGDGVEVLGFDILDSKVENFYPDMDAIKVTIEGVVVSVSRDEEGETHVAVVHPDTRVDLVLGKEGETQSG